MVAAVDMVNLLNKIILVLLMGISRVQPCMVAQLVIMGLLVGV